VVLETVRCTVVDYLDAFERIRLQITSLLTKFCEVHVYGAIETSSVMDGLLTSSDLFIDFAENSYLDNYRQIQSGYWTSTTYNLQPTSFGLELAVG